MKSKLHYKEDYLYESVTDEGHKVMIDMRKDGKKTGQSPVEMVVSALAACISVDVVLILKKRRKEIKNFTVELNAHRKETHPKYIDTTHAHFIVESNNTSKEEVEKYIKTTIDKYCSVGASLKTTLTFSIEIISTY